MSSDPVVLLYPMNIIIIVQVLYQSLSLFIHVTISLTNNTNVNAL